MKKDSNRNGRSSRTLIVLCTAGSILQTACMTESHYDGDELDIDIDSVSAPLVENCGEILSQGIFEKYDLKNDSSATYALAHGFCKEHKFSTSGGGGGGFSYLGFGVNASGSYSKETYDNYCEYFEQADTSDNYLSIMTSMVDADIVEAWKACVTRTEGSGLRCTQERDGSADVINLDWDDGKLRVGSLTGKPPLQKTLTFRNMTVANAYDAEPTLYVGQTGLQFQRVDAKADSLFTFNGLTSTKVSQTCSVLVRSPVSIRKELGESWKRLAATYSDVGAALKARKFSGTADLIRDRAYAALMAKAGAATANGETCSAARATCKAPLGDDFNFRYVNPGLKQRDGDIIYKSKARTENILEVNAAFLGVFIVADAKTIDTIRNIPRPFQPKPELY